MLIALLISSDVTCDQREGNGLCSASLLWGRSDSGGDSPQQGSQQSGAGACMGSKDYTSSIDHTVSGKKKLIILSQRPAWNSSNCTS